MGTIEDKLKYLNTTKIKLKDSINLTGANITNDTTFRNYSIKLKESLVNILKGNIWDLFDNFDTVEDSGEEVFLNNSYDETIMKIDLKGNTKQDIIEADEGITLSDTLVYANNVNTGKEHTIELSGNTYQETNANVFNGTLAQTTYTGTGAVVENSPTRFDFINGYTYTINIKFTSNNVSTIDQNRILGFRTYKDIGYTGRGLIISYDNLSSGTGSITFTAEENYNRFSFINYADFQSGTITITDFEIITNTPTPDYPQNIEVVTGTQNVEVCGKNLFDKSNITTGKTFTNTGAIINLTNSFIQKIYIPVSSETDYTMSTTNDYSSETDYRLAVCEYDSNKDFIKRNLGGSSTGNKYTITTSSTTKYVRLCASTITLDELQFEQGSSATTYEAYQGTTYPINLGNIELCKIDTYKDRIYKSNDKWYLEKNIGKITLNGSENWKFTSNGNAMYIFQWCQNNNAKIPLNNDTLSNSLSNYFKNITRNNIVNEDYGQGMALTGALNIKHKDYISSTLLSDFKTWLSTHNTIVYYLLATPTTTEITDTNLVNQLNALYNATIYPITNINTDTSNLLPYIDLHYNFITPSPSPNRPSVVNVVKGNNTITISNSDNTESQVFPINLGDIELCKIGTYQDYIYESNGNWFKKNAIGKVVLNGTQEIFKSSVQTINRFGITFTNLGITPINATGLSSRLIYKSSSSSTTGTYYIAENFSNLYIDYSTYDSTTANDFKTWLQSNNIILYLPLATPTDTQITDTTLINQLNLIKDNACSYDNQTNITQENANAPFIITAEAIDKTKI